MAMSAFYIILPRIFSVKLPPLRLSFPFPFWRSPVLPPTLTHPLRPPSPDEYRCSALLRYRYAPSDIGASLDSYLTLPYCCSKCGGRHVGNIRHPNSANIIVSFYHMVKSMFLRSFLGCSAIEVLTVLACVFLIG